MKPILLLLLTILSYPLVAQPELKPIAVVELFTSQGCSSCPSADRLLKEAVNTQSTKGEVYGLSFHVSYWNRLGWTDPYSSEQFTERQKWYAQKMKLRTIYTPQMVVDGQTEFVGSQKATFNEALKASFASGQKDQIKLDQIKQSKDKLSLNYTCKGSTEDLLLNVAVVQVSATNYIPRGENVNKTLTHAHVVRSFKTVPARASGALTLDLPVLDADTSYALIAFLQHPNSMAITAAGKLEL